MMTLDLMNDDILQVGHRDFLLIRDDEFFLWSIKPTKGAELAVSLRGKFTSLERAKHQIDLFIASNGRHK